MHDTASMVDYTLSLHKQAYPDAEAPGDIEAQRSEAHARNERLGREVETVLNVIEDPSVAAALKQDKAQNLAWLEENYQVSKEARAH